MYVVNDDPSMGDDPSHFSAFSGTFQQVLQLLLTEKFMAMALRSLLRPSQYPGIWRIPGSGVSH